MEGGPSRVSYRVERGCVARRQIISTFFFGWRNYWVPAIKSRELHWAAALGTHATPRQHKIPAQRQVSGQTVALVAPVATVAAWNKATQKVRILGAVAASSYVRCAKPPLPGKLQARQLGSASGWNARLVGLAISGFTMSRRTGQKT